MDYCLVKLADLQELKSFHVPPETVKLVIYAVLALFGEDETLPKAKNFLSNPHHVMTRLSSFNISSITKSRAKQVDQYINNPLLSIDASCKASRTCYNLWRWLLVVHQEYTEIHGQSAPKKKKFRKKPKQIFSQFTRKSVETPPLFQEENSAPETKDAIIIDAIRGLQSLTRNSLNELKSFHNPPDVVKLVCSAMLSLFGEATTWTNAKVRLTLKAIANSDIFSIMTTS